MPQWDETLNKMTKLQIGTHQRNSTMTTEVVLQRKYQNLLVTDGEKKNTDEIGILTAYCEVFNLLCNLHLLY